MLPETDFDVAVIGAGVSGAVIARTLSRYDLSIALLEKEADVSFGTSKGNSGIIHGGFHHAGSYLKTRLEIAGSRMFDNLQKELDFPFKRCGILVIALREEELRHLHHLFSQGQENGAEDLELCSRERTLSLEPKLHPDVLGGLFVPAGGIIEPYRFVFSLVESAVKNGVTLLKNFHVRSAVSSGGDFVIQAEDGRNLRVTYVINAAGLYADEVSALFGAEEYSIRPRKGEYYVLDKSTRACPGRIIFPVPSGVSKGMLVVPTVEGTVLIGPSAEEVREKDDLATSGDQLQRIIDSARNIVPGISESDVIAAFAGLRPSLEDEDFYIAPSEKVPRFIQVAGIQSPGLTASPAIGEYVKDIFEAMLKAEGGTLKEKDDYDPFIDKVPRLRDLSAGEAAELIKRNPAYGNLVCRCEQVSEAEVLEAVRRGHDTLDGIKYYTRCTMGRCQGGFCTYHILKILKRETGLEYGEMTKRGAESPLLLGEL